MPSRTDPRIDTTAVHFDLLYSVCIVSLLETAQYVLESDHAAVVGMGIVEEHR